MRHLCSSGVMTDRDIADACDKVDPKDRPRTPEDLARLLVRQGRLTKFQAQMAYNGKAHKLMLGNYALLDRLGAGGMGQVYLAEHRRMERTVALKVLPPEATKDPDQVKRFHREVKVAARLSHPNVVTAFDADEADGVHFMVMEHVSGADLQSVVRQQGPLPVDQAVDCIMQAAHGLEYAHAQGVIHRDIKPANLLLQVQAQDSTLRGRTVAGEFSSLAPQPATVKVLDMGLARVDEAVEATRTGLTQTGVVMGTVDFMSPEQARDTKTADARADVYSLGCTLWYLLTGRSVYEGDTVMSRLLAHRDQQIPSLSEERPEVPPALDAVFQKMIAKDPDHRYQSMGEVLVALANCGVLRPGRAPAETVTLHHTDPEYDDFLKVIAEEPSPVVVQAKKKSKKTAARPTPSADTQVSGSFDQTGTPLPARRRGRSTRTASRQQAARRKRTIALAAVAVALLGFGSLWLAGVIFRVKTPEGTIVLEIDQPEAAGAEVFVDGQKQVTIKTPGEQPVEITVNKERGTLEVRKGGFKTFAKTFTVASGGKERIHVRLDPLPAQAANVPPRQSAKSALQKSNADDADSRRDQNWALEFDGESSIVDLPLSYGGKDTVTVEAYVRPFSLPSRQIPVGTQAILLAVKDDPGAQYWFMANTSQRGDSVDRGHQVYGGTKGDATNRVHIAGIRQGGVLRLFVDGKECTRRTTYRDPPDLATTDIRTFRFSIGGTILRYKDRVLSQENFFHGIIDEVRISNVARYDKDFTPSKRFEPDEHTLALYHFDEGSGDVLHDSSGHNHHGKIVGAKWVRVDDDLNVIPPRQSAKSALQKTNADYADDRRAAEWVLNAGGYVYVRLRDGKGLGVRSGGELPAEPFVLVNVQSVGEQTRFTDEGMQNLRSLQSLESVRVIGCQNLSDAAVAALVECPNVSHLYLSFVPVTDACADSLIRLESLTYLDLSETWITDAGWKIILAQLRRLEYISAPPRVTDAGMSELAGLPNLTKVYVKSHHITRDSINVLNSLKKLTALSVVAARDEELQLIAELPQVESLSFNLSRFRPVAVANLAQLPKLNDLSLGDSPNVSDAHVQAVAARLPKLTGLSLYKTSITDRALEFLPGAMTQLKSLELRETKVTAAGVEKLHKALPNCEILWDGGTVKPASQQD